jgi:hypothetical protein
MSPFELKRNILMTIKYFTQTTKAACYFIFVLIYMEPEDLELKPEQLTTSCQNVTLSHLLAA